MEQHATWIEHGDLNGLYGRDVIDRIRHLAEKYINVDGKHILVIGSTLPWIESLLLTMNVGHITTLEYFPNISTHPRVTLISPTDFALLVRSNKAPKFDAMISFSSLEHSGLGR